MTGLWREIGPARTWNAIAAVARSLAKKGGSMVRVTGRRRIRLELEASLRLDSRNSVHAIGGAGRRWLLVCGPSGASVVAELGVDESREAERC